MTLGRASKTEQSSESAGLGSAEASLPSTPPSLFCVSTPVPLGTFSSLARAVGWSGMQSIRGQGGQPCHLPGEDMSAGQRQGRGWGGGFREGQSIYAGEGRQPLLGSHLNSSLFTNANPWVRCRVLVLFFLLLGSVTCCG